MGVSSRTGVVVVIWGLGAFLPSLAQAQSNGGVVLAEQRQRFLELLESRRRTGQPQTIPIGRQSADAFNHRLNMYADQNGLVPPPIPPFFRNNPPTPRQLPTIQFRRAFTMELYRQRASRQPDGIAGGAFWGLPPSLPSNTPVIVSSLNIFDFFPAFRINGLAGNPRLAEMLQQRRAVQQRASGGLASPQPVGRMTQAELAARRAALQQARRPQVDTARLRASMQPPRARMTAAELRDLRLANRPNAGAR